MKKLVALMGLSAAGLNGCSIQDDSVCTPLPPVESRMQASIAAEASNTPPSERVFAAITGAEFCIQQTARKYAPSRDGADVVAKAVVANCRVAILRVADAQYMADQASGNVSPVISSTTGRETTLAARTFEEMSALALSKVVEARAGRCKATK